MVVLGGGAVSYERGTPVPRSSANRQAVHPTAGADDLVAVWLWITVGCARAGAAAICETVNNPVSNVQKPFLGGAEPNMGDVSVFGVLRAVEGFETGTALLEGSNVTPHSTFLIML